MSKEEIYQIIGEVLSGTSDPHKRELLNSWIEESQENFQTYNLLKESWESTRIETRHPHEQCRLQSVLSKIESEDKPWWLTNGFLLKIAASLGFFIVCSWLYLSDGSFFQQIFKGDKTITQKSNVAGQKSSFKLPDGTAVWLNSESTLAYDSDYGVSKREVKLLGEAYFEVKKDKKRAFIVTSGNLKTTALGTSFNIQAFPEEDNLIVSLIEGRVRVDQYQSVHHENVSSNIFLKPGERISYSKGNNSFEKSEFDVVKAGMWKEGTLIFDDEDFLDILKELERWYGVQIEVINRPEREAVRFSGKFHHESLESILLAMSYSKKFTYKIDGKTITIQFNQK
ncbi:MAG: FecR domain-containing protein [Reichenbachiella sp.]|uniref:FecR family protein n=1 Tax=Reichenbachiella sp. TaxID=2184521 RepID=UPI0032978155